MSRPQAQPPPALPLARPLRAPNVAARLAAPAAGAWVEAKQLPPWDAALREELPRLLRETTKDQVRPFPSPVLTGQAVRFRALPPSSPAPPDKRIPRFRPRLLPAPAAGAARQLFPGAGPAGGGAGGGQVVQDPAGELWDGLCATRAQAPAATCGARTGPAAACLQPPSLCLLPSFWQGGALVEVSASLPNHRSVAFLLCPSSFLQEAGEAEPEYLVEVSASDGVSSSSGGADPYLSAGLLDQQIK